MRRRNQREQILNRILGEYSRIPDKQLEAEVDRAWSDLQTKIRLERTGRPERVKERVRLTRRWGQLSIIAVAAVLVLIVFMRMHTLRDFRQEIEIYAVVESADGGLFQASGGQALHVGNKIEHGDIVRSDRGIGTVLALADGSHIEMRPQSTLSLERATDGVRIRLDTGGIIVAAAKQSAGHLYVQTKDVVVSV